MQIGNIDYTQNVALANDITTIMANEGIERLEEITAAYLGKDLLPQHKETLVKLKNSMIGNIRKFLAVGYPLDKLDKQIIDYIVEINREAHRFEVAKNNYRGDISAIDQKIKEFREKIPAFEPSNLQTYIEADHPILKGLSEQQKKQRRAILSLRKNQQTIVEDPCTRQYLKKNGLE